MGPGPGVSPLAAGQESGGLLHNPRKGTEKTQILQSPKRATELISTSTKYCRSPCVVAACMEREGRTMKRGFFAVVTVPAAVVLIAVATLGRDRNDTPGKHQEQGATSMPHRSPEKQLQARPKRPTEYQRLLIGYLTNIERIEKEIVHQRTQMHPKVVAWEKTRSDYLAKHKLQVLKGLQEERKKRGNQRLHFMGECYERKNPFVLGISPESADIAKTLYEHGVFEGTESAEMLRPLENWAFLVGCWLLIRRRPPPQAVVCHHRPFNRIGGRSLRPHHPNSRIISVIVWLSPELQAFILSNAIDGLSYDRALPRCSLENPGTTYGFSAVPRRHDTLRTTIRQETCTVDSVSCSCPSTIRISSSVPSTGLNIKFASAVNTKVRITTDRLTGGRKEVTFIRDYDRIVAKAHNNPGQELIRESRFSDCRKKGSDMIRLKNAFPLILAVQVALLSAWCPVAKPAPRPPRGGIVPDARGRGRIKSMSPELDFLSVMPTHACLSIQARSARFLGYRV